MPDGGGVGSLAVSRGVSGGVLKRAAHARIPSGSGSSLAGGGLIKGGIIPGGKPIVFGTDNPGGFDKFPIGISVPDAFAGSAGSGAISAGAFGSAGGVSAIACTHVDSRALPSFAGLLAGCVVFGKFESSKGAVAFVTARCSGGNSASCSSQSPQDGETDGVLDLATASVAAPSSRLTMVAGAVTFAVTGGLTVVSAV